MNASVLLNKKVSAGGVAEEDLIAFIEKSEFNKSNRSFVGGGPHESIVSGKHRSSTKNKTSLGGWV